MPLYLGPLGALQSFPNLQRGYQRPLTRLGGTHTLADGSLVVDVTGYRQDLSLEGRGLTATELSTLEALYTTPVRPLLLVDPAARNLLSANQSSGTDTLGTTQGFNPPNGTLTSTTDTPWQGQRALAWSYPVMDAFQPLWVLEVTTLDPEIPTRSGVPVVPGQPYTFSAWMRVESGAEDFGLFVDWHDIDDNFLSFTGPSATPEQVTTTYQRFTASGVAPEGAAIAMMNITNPAATATAGTLYVDGVQFESRATATPWAQGREVPLVEFVDVLASSVSLVGIHQVTVQLRQAVIR